MRVESLGDATLYLADCMEILSTLSDVDTVFTSPPYNCGKDYGTRADDLPLNQYVDVLRAIFLPRSRCQIVNVGEYVGSRKGRVRAAELLRQASGKEYVDQVIWDKGPANSAAWGNFPNSPRIRAQHESVYAYFDAPMRCGNGLSWGEWSALTTSIWRIPPPRNDRHPATMPVALAERAVSLWADRSGVVLDMFMGTGTTGVACINVGRKFIGIEIEPEYFEIACERIDMAQRQGKLFEVPK